MLLGKMAGGAHHFTWLEAAAYGRYQGKKGERMMAAAAAVEEPGTSDADPQPADITKTADQA